MIALIALVCSSMTFALSRLPALCALVLLCGTSALHAQDEAPSHHAATSEPASFQGHWCGRGFLSGTALSLTQHRHEFEGTLVRGDRSRKVDGRIEGTMLHTSRASSGRAGELVLQIEGDLLRIVAAGGPLTLARGMTFARASGPGC
ncbi:MAG: hypothetical protein NVSMB34_01670 [Variovorax sp.]